MVDAHVASYEDPIAVSKGDRVLLGRRDDQYPGWIWCIGPGGREGWTPEQFLSLDAGEGATRSAGEGEAVTDEREASAGEAVATVDYDARELTVTAGEELTVADEVGGWLLCERRNGERGWLPAAVTAPAA